MATAVMASVAPATDQDPANGSPRAVESRTPPTSAIEVDETIAYSCDDHGSGRPKLYRPRDARSPTTRKATITAVQVGEPGNEYATSSESTATATLTTMAGSALRTRVRAIELTSDRSGSVAVALASPSARSVIALAPAASRA